MESKPVKFRHSPAYCNSQNASLDSFNLPPRSKGVGFIVRSKSPCSTKQGDFYLHNPAIGVKTRTMNCAVPDKCPDIILQEEQR